MKKNKGKAGPKVGDIVDSLNDDERTELKYHTSQKQGHRALMSQLGEMMAQVREKEISWWTRLGKIHGLDFQKFVYAVNNHTGVIRIEAIQRVEEGVRTPHQLGAKGKNS